MYKISPCWLVIAFILMLNITVVICSASAAISCKDDNGNSVDWFYGTKHPQDPKRSNYNLNPDGKAYLYLLSSQPEVTNWTLSAHNIDDPMSMFGRTLSPLYKNSEIEVQNYVLYNDEEPGGRVVLGGGHMKGILAFDQSTGFWLVHSVPKFPNKAGDVYGYPTTGLVYAQSFLCITISSSQVNIIGSQFKFTLPNVYDSHLEPWVKDTLPDLWTWMAQKTILKKPPWYNTTYVRSSEGVPFNYFAKHPKFNNDLYAHLVAPALTADLWVESWQHGVGKVLSDCTGSYTVKNVKVVTIRPLNYDYKNGHDHSKWAIAAADASTIMPWVCIGDINRMLTQYRRGGGTVCMSSSRVHLVYNSSTNSTEACPKYSTVKTIIDKTDGVFDYRQFIVKWFTYVLSFIQK